MGHGEDLRDSQVLWELGGRVDRRLRILRWLLSPGREGCLALRRLVWGLLVVAGLDQHGELVRDLVLSRAGPRVEIREQSFHRREMVF